MENSIIVFQKGVCFYDGVTTLEELREDELERYREEESQHEPGEVPRFVSKFENGMYEGEAISEPFYLYAPRGNEILRFAHRITCQHCDHSAYMDSTKSYVISDEFGTIRRLPLADGAPDDFDYQSAGLKSPSDADYVYGGFGEVAYVIETGKQIECSEFSLSQRLLDELSKTMTKIYYDKIATNLTRDAIVARLKVKKVAKPLVFNMRDIVVPVADGFLVRDLNYSETKLIYGNERAMQCPSCRVRLSSVTGVWDGEFSRVQLSDTSAYADDFRAMIKTFAQVFDTEVEKKLSALAESHSTEISQMYDSFYTRAAEDMNDAVKSEWVYVTNCEFCGEELIYSDVVETAPEFGTVVPFLDAATTDLVLNSRFGSYSPTFRVRKSGIQTQTRFDISVYKEIFGFGSSNAKKKDDAGNEQKEEKLPRGWKLVKSK
jgi:hypothetical protein